MFDWMAWTWPTAFFFIFVFACISIMGVLEWRNPGGDSRDGILGLRTTRGDRLFIWILGSIYIFLGWLGLIGMPLWAPLALSIFWGVFCFRKI